MKPPEVLRTVDPDGQEGKVFDELAGAAIRRHTRTKSLVRHFDAGDRRIGFSIADAAKEAIKRSRIPPIDIWRALIKITSIEPAEVSDPLAFPGETWEEFATEVSCAILWREIYLLHPKVLHEDARRDEYWAARTKK